MSNLIGQSLGRYHILDQLGEGGNRFGACDQGKGDLPVGHRTDRTAQIGDAIQDFIVEGQQHAIAGDMYVSLQVRVAEFDRMTKCGLGVLKAFDVWM